MGFYVTEAFILSTSKYNNKTLAKNKQALLAKQLEGPMKQEQPCLSEKLSLVDLSKMITISQNDLSQLFNSH